MPSEPVHLRPTAELAPRVLLPGDPGRALLLAQALLDGPRMFNHHRGLWGYTGDAADGEPLTIQATGMGGPSTAIVAWELVDLGARTLVRVGTCGSLVEDLRLEELVVASEALSFDGTSRALGAGDRIGPDPGLEAAVAAAVPGAARGPVVTTDLFYEPGDGGAALARAADEGAIAVEMESATLFALARVRGVAAATVLVVSDELAGGRRRRLDAAGLERAGEAVGRAGAAAVLAAGA